MKRCLGGKGLTSVKDCVLSECNGLWDYSEKSEVSTLKEVVKEGFMLKKGEKKEYDSRTKEKNETNWKEKKLTWKFP